MWNTDTIPNLQNAKKSENTDTFTLLGQGGYGCAFYPEIKCKTQKPGSKKYLTKIQIKNKSFENEVNIGKLVQNIPNYKFFFAPVLEHCDVNISTIDKDQISKCEIITEELTQNKSTQFVSNKILYVGENKLSDYFEKLMTVKKPPTQTFVNYISKIGKAHLYLLESVQLLNENDILHLDIVSRNIMYDSKNDIPILIDFGLSTQIQQIETDRYMKSKTPFGVGGDHIYPPWCIEIVLLSNIARKIKKKNTASNASYIDEQKFLEKIPITVTEELKKLCTLHVHKNDSFNSIIYSKDELQDFEKRLHTWINTFNGKSWKEVWTMIVSTNKSWDNYSLSMLFLNEVEDSGLLKLLYTTPSTNVQQQNPLHPNVFRKYTDILKEHTLSDPMKRKSAKELHTDIKNVFGTINKTLFLKSIKHIVDQKITGEENIQKMKLNRKQQMLTELQNEDKIIEKRRQP
jgi:hypothetical protein